MAGSTSNQALPYPTSGDAPDGPAQLLALAQAIERKLVQVFASVADRTARVTPTEGMRCWLQDKNRFEYVTGAGIWVPEPFGSIFRARQTVTQSIPSAAYTPLVWGTEEVDDDNAHSTSSNTSRYVCPWTGWYLVSGTVCWASSTAGRRGAQWWVNGVAVPGGSQTLIPTIGAGTATTCSVAATLPVLCSAGDYIELHAYQDSGSALGTGTTSGAQSAINVMWLRP